MLVSYPRLRPVATLLCQVAQLQSVPRLLGALGDVLADARDDPPLSLVCSLAHYSDYLVMPGRSLAVLGGASLGLPLLVVLLVTTSRTLAASVSA